MIKNNLKIILILIFSLLIRCLLITTFPNGLTNDELHFILNAKSVFYSFTNLQADWSPISLNTIPNEISSELTFIFLAPIIGLLPLNLFTAKLPFILIGLGTIYLIYLITRFILNERIATASAIIASINPWMYYVNRTSFDAPIAVFFFLLTLYLLLFLKRKLIFLAIIPAIFAFYTYIGTKVIFFPIIVIFCLFAYNQRRQYKLYYLLISVFSLFIVGHYLINLKSNGGLSRTSELWTPFSRSISLKVEQDRQFSIKAPFTPIFINRYTVYTRQFFEKYLNNFTPGLFFLTGDTTFLVSLWRHGYFYLIDLFLFFFGVIYLFSKSKKKFLFIISLIILSPIPEAIRSDSIPAYAFHSCFQYPFLLIIAGSGLVYLYETLNYKIFRLVSIFITILFVNFLFIYFYQYPIYQPEGFFFSNRLITNFIRLQEKSSPNQILVITQEPNNLFRNYLFFNNLITRDNLPKIQQASKNPNNIRYGNITFTQKKEITDFTNLTLIVETKFSSTSYQQFSTYHLNHLSDNSPIFSIYNSKICGDIRSKFPRIYSFDLFHPETMTTNQYCQNFIFN